MFRRFRKSAGAGVADQEVATRICGKTVKYVSLRCGFDPSEKIIGREGFINYSDGRVVICCGSSVALDRALADMTVGELLSKNGATFTFDDGGQRVTVTAYYTHYHK